MKIVVPAHKRIYNLPISFKTVTDTFFVLRKYFNGLKKIYVINDDLAFIEVSTFKNGGVELKNSPNVEKELKFYELYQKSIRYAILAHGTQKYGGFLPYFFHLNQTDKVIDYFGKDIPNGVFFKVKTAAILHDVLEDTKVSYEQLKIDFGQEIADIVFCVTKINEKNTIDFETDYYQKMSQNPLAVLVKIADKAANCKQTIKDKSIWHAQRIIKGHPIFKKYTYPSLSAPHIKKYLDDLINKLNEVING